MEQMHTLIERIRNLLLDLNDDTREDNIDSYGVGAIMPQDMPQGLLSNPELYGI